VIDAPTASLVSPHGGRRIAIPLLSQPPVVPDGAIHRVAGATMGTTWEVSVVLRDGARLEAIGRRIQTRLDGIVAEMSTWRDDSDLRCFNDAAPGFVTSIPAAFAAVLTCALDVAALSGGTYDPTVGPLVNLWGFGPERRVDTPPCLDEVDAARRRVGYMRVAFEPHARRLTQPGGMYLDFSAIAKGFAVDAVIDVLRHEGCSSALVDIGGELRGMGIKPDGQPWWVSLERPALRCASDGDQPEETVLALCDLAVATSGDYRRFFDHDGRRYAHTIDPRTGWPARDVASVTVVDSSCMRADALSTALTVLGVVDGLRFCDAHQVSALFIMRDGDRLAEHLSPAFEALLA